MKPSEHEVPQQTYSEVECFPNEQFPIRAVRGSSGYGAANQGSAGDEKVDTLELNRWLTGPARESFWLTRLVLLRCMGGIYLAAFLTSGMQSRQLFGPRGLSPAEAGPSFTGAASSEMHLPPDRPTPAFALLGLTDVSIAIVSWTGFFFSLVMLAGECTTALIPGVLWLLWLSVVNLGSPFIMNYGWEWQVCETGLLIMCLCHLPSCSDSWRTFWRKDFPRECPTPYPVLLLLRWLCFRVMIGAGLSKINPLTWQAQGSRCWEDLTCTATHYETTGAPNPIGYFMHHQPMLLHKGEVFLNHFVELIVPWFFLVPFYIIRRFAACVSLLFMACIACTGNYAYINHITAVPMIACLDDAFLSRLFSTSVLNEACAADQACGASDRSWWSCIFSGQWPIDPAVDRENHQGNPLAKIWRACDFFLRHTIYFVLVLVIAEKSTAPLRKTFGSRPWLEFYDDYFIENSYGVFGFVNTVRLEMTLSYLPHTASEQGLESDWEPLEFNCKPSSLDRMPCIINPYHDRFDWVTWIETTASLEGEYLAGGIDFFSVPEHVSIAASKLLRGDVDMASLFGTPVHKLFRNGQPPAQIRAELWLYKFSSLSDLLQHGQWWQRKEVVTGDQAVQHVGAGSDPGEISHVPPTHDYLLFTCSLGGFLAVLGLGDQPRDLFWRKPGVLLGSCLLTFSIFRTFIPRFFLAHWLATTLVFVTYERIVRGQVLSDLWKAFPNVLPPQDLAENESCCTQARKFRLLNGILASDFLMIFVIAILVPECGGYWAALVLAVLGFCSIGIVAQHATEYTDGVSLGAALILLSVMLDAGRAACFQLPVLPR